MHQPMFNLARFVLLAGLLLVVINANHAKASPLRDEGGAFIALSVRNLEQSIAWYTTHLKFELESQDANEQRKGALLTGPGALLELAEFSDAVARDSLRRGIESHQVHGLFKLGFVISDLDDRFSQLQAAEVDIMFPVISAAGGRRTFAVRDPDGNIVQFFGR